MKINNCEYFLAKFEWLWSKNQHNQSFSSYTEKIYKKHFCYKTLL